MEQTKLQPNWNLKDVYLFIETTLKTVENKEEILIYGFVIVMVMISSPVADDETAPLAT